MELDLRLVRYTVAVADELHFARAAARLMITEQTLSAQIKAFESRLGVELFHRDRRHVEITPAGAILVDRGRTLLAEAAELLNEVTRVPARLKVDIYMEGLAPTAVAELLSARAKELVVEVTQGYGLHGSAGRILSGELDLACGRASTLTNNTAYACQPLRLDPIGVMLRRDHVLAGRPAVGTAELAEFPLLVFSPAEATEWVDWQRELCAEFGVERGLLVHGQGIRAARLTVLTHGGPLLCSMDLPSTDDTVVRPLVNPIPLYPWSLVWRAGRREPHLLKAIETIREYGRAKGWLIPPDEVCWVPEIDRDELRLIRSELSKPLR